MEVPANQRIVGHSDLTIPASLLVVATGQWANEPDHPITTTELIAVGKQVGVVIDPEQLVRAFGDGELDPFIAFKCLL